METYRVNDLYYSLQGEGARAGMAAIFVRFAGCNLACEMEPGPRSPGGFDCDTDFAHGDPVDHDALLTALFKLQQEVSPRCRELVLTGGEPALQLTTTLLRGLYDEGWRVGVETNGTIDLQPWRAKGLLPWITVSPKVGELVQVDCDEVRYVLAHGMPFGFEADRWPHTPNRYVSPAHVGDVLPLENLAWCIDVVTTYPNWRLSVQQHKTWRLP